MEANGESTPTGDVDESSPQVADLEQKLANMTVEDASQKEQAAQTETTTQESGVNTEASWESEVEALMEYKSRLVEQSDALTKTQEQDEAEHKRRMQQLQKKKKEATRQHQALLDKLDSVRVKLQQSDSKAARENFLSKKQELMAEKTRAEEKRDRLAQELEESDRKLTALTEEQHEEQRRWKDELEELRAEMERVRAEAQEAELLALQDEIAAVEKQRDVALSCIEAWQREVSQYLNALRSDFPQQYPQEKLSWEKKESAAQRHKAEMESRCQEVLQQLQQGRQLDALPRIPIPSLPHVPMANVTFNQLMQSLVPPIQVVRPIATARQPSCHPPPPLHLNRFHPPPPHRPQYQPHVPAPAQVTPLPGHWPPPPTQTYPVAPSPPLPAAAAPSSKLNILLEKLAARYPQVSRTQLTLLLQQVKTSRGTLAGMSTEEVVEQVGLRLTVLGPIGLPAQMPPAGPPKLCLMCQNPVDPESRHPLSCSHTVHRHCIHMWLQSSRNNPCPFCPSR